jgi:hypothetical protein
MQRGALLALIQIDKYILAFPSHGTNFLPQESSMKLKNFFKFWGIAFLLWVGVAYEFYVLGPKLISAILHYL